MQKEKLTFDLLSEVLYKLDSYILARIHSRLGQCNKNASYLLPPLPKSTPITDTDTACICKLYYYIKLVYNNYSSALQASVE